MRRGACEARRACRLPKFKPPATEDPRIAGAAGPGDPAVHDRRGPVELAEPPDVAGKQEAGALELALCRQQVGQVLLSEEEQ